MGEHDAGTAQGSSIEGGSSTLGTRMNDGISVALRFSVLKRDRFMCVYCGRSPPEVRLHVDHVRSRSDGGETTFHNLVSACSDCNAGKGAQSIDPENMKWWLSLQERIRRHEEPDPTAPSKGGHARAAVLAQDRRLEIARSAAKARWDRHRSKLAGIRTESACDSDEGTSSKVDAG